MHDDVDALCRLVVCTYVPDPNHIAVQHTIMLVAAQEERAIEDHWRAVRERDAAEAARKEARKEAADRIYDRLRAEHEAAARGREEEEELINMLRQARARRH
jgi:hypothetical protein